MEMKNSVFGIFREVYTFKLNMEHQILKVKTEVILFSKKMLENH